jgi:hypothetical protein
MPCARGWQVDLGRLTFIKNTCKIQAWEKSTMIAEKDMDRVMAILKIIWMALLGSLAVYLIVGRLVAPVLMPQLGGEAFRMLRTALYALGFVTLIAAGYVRRLILAPRGPSAGPTQARQYSGLQKYSSWGRTPWTFSCWLGSPPQPCSISAPGRTNCSTSASRC